MKAGALSSTEPEVRTITAAEFKAKCLQLMDEVNEKKLTLVITKRGKPVMEACSPKADTPILPLFGLTPGARILGDIMAPLDWGDSDEKWERLNREPLAVPTAKTRKVRKSGKKK